MSMRSAAHRPTNFRTWGWPLRLLLPPPLIGRLIAQKLTEAWGQSVVVDNKPGAGLQTRSHR